LSFGLEKEIGKREQRKGKESQAYGVAIRMEFMTKIKILSNGLVETGVLREKPLMMAKLRVDYCSLPLFL
jgi:hypothetical protein